MNILTSADLCKEVNSRIAFHERENNCIISIFEDDEFTYMSVIAKDFSYAHGNIKLCKKDASKYALCHAIREYFMEGWLA